MFLFFLEKDIHLKGIEMNELERTALNEILRTVTYIAEKLDELDIKFSQLESVKENLRNIVV